MTVRARIALTIFLTGLVTAVGVIVTVVVAFQRFERETTFDRAGAFLARVVSLYDNIFDLHQRQPEEFAIFLRNLVLLEADTQLYLLDAQGTVLASTGSVALPAGFRVAIEPVRQAVQAYALRRDGRQPALLPAPYVMGDDPEHMDADAVVAAQPLRRQGIDPASASSIAGYLYLVSHGARPENRLSMFRSTLAGPAICAVALLVALTTLTAAWIVATVTRPLRALSADVAAVARDGLAGAPPPAGAHGAFAAGPADVSGGAAAGTDEFAQLRAGFHAMLGTLRSQWDALRRLDHFRREGVSNLSHDLRSPLTATVACLETLEQRFAAGEDAEDRRLVEVALRNTRNAARLVRSLGELAQLDEPSFALRPAAVDLGELLDDIRLRFATRAEQAGVHLLTEDPAPDDAMPVADVDIELFERAVANLVDNALKFCPRGARVTLRAAVDEAAREVLVTVEDTGPGIPAPDLPHLFDRHYQSRHSVTPATADGGKGLGLAIVRRIVELHRGQVDVDSVEGRGTRVRLRLPWAGA
jgi:signal transduction histidine kinase